MNKHLIQLFFFVSTLCAGETHLFQEHQKLVLQTKRYAFKKFPGAFNPSLIQADDGFILTFRYCPEESTRPWISYIGIVTLDKDLNPIEEPHLLNTRPIGSQIPSQAEDARIFSFKKNLFVIYNDNIEKEFTQYSFRRDMFIAKIFQTENGYQLSLPLKLYHEKNYHQVMHQKNWIPFEWNETMYLSYSLFPHEVVLPNWKNGCSKTAYKTESTIQWDYGPPRGSTPPILIDGEYLAFFHSSLVTSSPPSYYWDIWHYFMGAYTFSAEPPFEITKVSEKPILGNLFYTISNRWKRVVFPGGFVVSGPNLYVAYGKDDCEIWIATIDLAELKKSLVPVTR